MCNTFSLIPSSYQKYVDTEINYIDKGQNSCLINISKHEIARKKQNKKTRSSILSFLILVSSGYQWVVPGQNSSWKLLMACNNLQKLACKSLLQLQIISTRCTFSRKANKKKSTVLHVKCMDQISLANQNIMKVKVEK